MVDFLLQPYPYFHKGRERLRNVGLILLLGFLFEYLLEPFERAPSEHLFSFWIICLIHASCSAIIYFLFSLLVSSFVKEENWKVYNEIIVLTILVFLVGTGGFLIREVIYDNPNNVSFRYFYEEVRNAYLVGSILLFIIIVANFNWYNKKYQKQAALIGLPTQSIANGKELVEIKAGLVSDHFTLSPTQVLCIRSDGNYLEFYLQNGNKVDKVLKRLTLQSASKQLAPFPFIVKTHRAYLVNILQLQKVTGNAQGYQLEVNNLDFKVPVSRGHIAAFDKMID